MASAAALRTRIKELSLTIRHQKDILRGLEKAKSEVQSDLNSILDPVARLPLELSSTIFMRCLPTKPIPHSNSAPMVFMAICRAWNQIAAATPSLWSAICIQSSRGHGFDKLLDLWLDRAGTRPLSISLHGPLDSAVGESIEGSADQVQTLELYFPSGEDLSEIRTPFPSLVNLVIGQGPRDNSGSNDPYDEGKYYSSTTKECLEMLRAAPNLVDCTFEELTFEMAQDMEDYDDPDHFTHPSLRRLCLQGSGFVLRYLTLPALETFSILTYYSICDDALLDFLKRSSPPLDSLRMANRGSNTVELLRLVPSLTNLRLDFSNSKADWLFEGLSIASVPDLLPNLRSLILTEVVPTSPQYDMLVKILSTRRAASPPMERFRLVCGHGYWGSAMPDIGANVIASLKQFVADGMEIHVGTKTDNFI